MIVKINDQDCYDLEKVDAMIFHYYDKYSPNEKENLERIAIINGSKVSMRVKDFETLKEYWVEFKMGIKSFK